jgi:hypothetical protein
VVVHDDLAADPPAEHRRILEFAGLDAIEIVDVGTRRESRGVRYPWLQRLLKRPPKFLHPYLAGRQFNQRFASESSGGKPSAGKPSLRKRLLRWNRVPDVKQPIPLTVQQQIQAHYRDEINRLGVLLGRDLSHWLQPRSS